MPDCQCLFLRPQEQTLESKPCFCMSISCQPASETGQNHSRQPALPGQEINRERERGGGKNISDHTAFAVSLRAQECVLKTFTHTYVVVHHAHNKPSKSTSLDWIR